MHSTKPLAICFLLALLMSGCADRLPFPSGSLEGTVATAPDDWTDVASQNIIQLETNPDEPYSVNLWIIGKGEALYVNAGANRATWVEHIESNPDVRLRIGESIYLLRAERVTDQDIFDAFAEEWRDKYGNLPRNKNVNESFLYRLIGRS